MSFASQLTAMIDSGAGLVVGTVSDEGEPPCRPGVGHCRARRAGSAGALCDECRRPRRRAEPGDGAGVADRRRGGDVSVDPTQGRPVVVEPPTAGDIELARVQTATFFDVVHRTDGNPIEALWRMLPLQMVAVEMIVEETFDQTPGPAAGAVIEGPLQ